MRRLLGGTAVILLGFLLNQLAATYDISFGLVAGGVSAAIGYGLLLTSAPAKIVWLWSSATRRRAVSVIVLAGILTGLCGAGATWALIWQSHHTKISVPQQVPGSNHFAIVPPAVRQPTAAEVASELARHLPKPETVGAQDSSDGVVTKAERYPEIDAVIAGSIAELFLVNGTADPVKVSVRIRTQANRFDKKQFASRSEPPPTIDLGQILVGERKRLAKIKLTDEEEEAIWIAADFGSGTSFNKPLSYRAYFRKPAQAWQFEYTLHDSYERRKLLQRGGMLENAAEKRRRVRFKLSQLIMHGNMLKNNFSWFCAPEPDETGRVAQALTLLRTASEIQAWGNETTFWTTWELGDSYLARLEIPAQNTQYPRGFEQLQHAENFRDPWDQLTARLAKLEEFMKELPEL